MLTGRCAPSFAALLMVVGACDPGGPDCKELACSSRLLVGMTSREGAYLSGLVGTVTTATSVNRIDCRGEDETTSLGDCRSDGQVTLDVDEADGGEAVAVSLAAEDGSRADASSVMPEWHLFDVLQADEPECRQECWQGELVVAAE